MLNKIIFSIASFFVFFMTGMAQVNPVPREADSLFFNMEYKQAIVKYRDFLRDNTNPAPVTLARYAFSNHFAGNYDEAIKYYDQAWNKKPASGLKGMLYSRMAMTYAMKNDKEKALIFLDSANANGYFNTYEMEHFSDFASIRNEPRFKNVYKAVYERAFPCKTRPEARAFDFWIGEWDVYNNAYPNHRVGSSSIQNVSGECTILENWTSFNNPFSGKSQNWYDPATKKWTQLWIGSGGGHQKFTDGEYKDGAMRFKLVQPDAKGYLQPGNFYFYNLGPDKVRQYQDLSSDSGKTFNVAYDFIYLRKKGTIRQTSSLNNMDDESKIRAINQQYVSEWLAGNEERVLSLFTEDASLAPSGMSPVKGKAAIRKFWFPKDGSKTSIEKFTNDIQHIFIEGDMAHTTQNDHLQWTYKKGSTFLKKEQWGFATTLYKKQPGGEWKIIHQMWKDYKVLDR